MDPGAVEVVIDGEIGGLYLMIEKPHEAVKMDQTRALGKFAARLVGSTSVSALAIGGACAQTGAQASAIPAEQEQTVIVTGLRASLESALN